MKCSNIQIFQLFSEVFGESQGAQLTSSVGMLRSACPSKPSGEARQDDSGDEGRRRARETRRPDAPQGVKRKRKHADANNRMRISCPKSRIASTAAFDDFPSA